MPKSLKTIAVVLLILIGCAIFWQWLSAQGTLTPERVAQIIETTMEWRRAWWMLPAVIVTYVIALLLVFPLTVLVVATGLLLGPVWGFFYAVAGSLASAAVSYWIGHWLGREALLNYGGARLNKIARHLAERGVRTMFVISLLPLAPFTLTNMLAGAFHLRFRHYFLGSVLGLVPGLAVVTLMGSQLGALVTAADRDDILWSLAGLAAGIGALLLLRHLANIRQRQNDPEVD
ncbi:phospholipase [Pseudidiomarina salinarum]|uniref:TVP38/TMEM64 family membrane protein n=1 Tax=Pseudidiomarina salinarum TaxID=435908 RepID=A0A094L8B0_9GAMM|nr:TVP38/TMEM64 family protein [Pseudidiomarina salinarum]KFZ31048.1 phospholipase [Pseudidiomarina salinarum]RUO71129.1 TVP38/TMEM64 family protein [Pseudidiomarina salinarum]